MEPSTKESFILFQKKKKNSYWFKKYFNSPVRNATYQLRKQKVPMGVFVRSASFFGEISKYFSLRSYLILKKKKKKIQVYLKHLSLNYSLFFLAGWGWVEVWNTNLSPPLRLPEFKQFTTKRSLGALKSWDNLHSPSNYLNYFTPVKVRYTCKNQEK